MRRDNALFGEDGAEIRRLYLDERLSCARIARRLGFPPEAEGNGAAIVLNRLKELGVKIHARGQLNLRFESAAAEWARRYKSGESTKEIAKGLTVDTTVARYLRQLGVELRGPSESHTRYPKHRFDGSNEERAYLLGFVRGDVSAVRQGGLIRCHTASTHQAQIDLFTSMFAPYGPIRVYPSVGRVSGFVWTIGADLDLSFEFLTQKSDTSRIIGRHAVLSYLAGLFDAEGYLALRTGRVFSPVWGITNTDSTMLDWAMQALTGLRFHPARTGRSPCEGKVSLARKEEVSELLSILPARHPEKKAKARLVLDHRTPELEKRVRWARLLGEIEHDRDQFVRASERELAAKGRGATNSVVGLAVCLNYLVNWMRFPLDGLIWTETLLWLGDYVDEPVDG